MLSLRSTGSHYHLQGERPGSVAGAREEGPRTAAGAMEGRATLPEMQLKQDRKDFLGVQGIQSKEWSTPDHWRARRRGRQRLNNQLNPTVLPTIIPPYFLLNLSHFQDVLCPIWFWSSVLRTSKQPRNMQLNVSLMSLLWSLLFRFVYIDQGSPLLPLELDCGMLWKLSLVILHQKAESQNLKRHIDYPAYINGEVVPILTPICKLSERFFLIL